jgi:hypothetical protein
MRERILEPLSEKLIAGDIRPGDRVVVDRAGEGLLLRTESRREAA